MLLWAPSSTRVLLHPHTRTSDFTLPHLFFSPIKTWVHHLLKKKKILRKHCIPSFSTSPLPSSPSTLSGTITPSVVAVKREQMLELLPTQSTKPPTAGLWTLSLLLHSHKEHRAATPAPTQTSASHLQRDRVDRFTYTVYQGFKSFLKKSKIAQKKRNLSVKIQHDVHNTTTDFRHTSQKCSCNSVSLKKRKLPGSV